VPTYDITEDVPIDLAVPSTAATFELTDVAYDIVIDDLPFIANVSNQNPYRRETAPYRKDQFDNSTEPGEQSLTGWWLRSQTSWHNGAGILFYEPGTDYQHVSHRFFDSRGIDIWTVGEATLLPEVFHAYTGDAGINAATGNDGTNDVLVSGNANGILKKITLSGDSAASTSNYTAGATYPDGHNGSNFPFHSVTTDGSTYYAACARCVHKGSLDTLTSDDVFFKHHTTDVNYAFVKYVKGSVLLGTGRVVGVLDTTAAPTSGTHTTGSADTLSNQKTHINSKWVWNDATESPGPIYLSGNGGNNGEVWKVTIDETTNAPDMAGATMSMSLPDGELVNAIHYYLGFLSVGTNKGIRICPINSNGDLVMGPLLIETSYPVKGFTERGSYMYAATKIDEGAYTNGILIRIDLSQQFDDGTFAYAYDLEYQSSLDADSSDCTEVYNLGDRLVMVIQEDGTAGELQVEHTTNKRSTGWLQTGKIRYGTVEPKFFRYLNVQCTTGQGDNITVYTIDKTETVNSLAILSEGLSNQDVLMTTLENKQEYISLRFVFNNVTDDQQLPVLEAYQIKATPATRRQRLYQYPLSCYDSEMDRFSSIFGYTGRAMEFIQRLESIEETGKFVNVTDYRTGEQYQGVIEEVRFTNESSPDKNNNGFGGLLLVTVRKL
jgi:hypothetical protein